jgi:hypothetical protein
MYYLKELTQLYLQEKVVEQQLEECARCLLTPKRLQNLGSSESTIYAHSEVAGPPPPYQAIIDLTSS